MKHATGSALILAAFAQACATPDLATPRQRDLAAIFCGEPGTETSAAYAQALDRDLSGLEAQGLTTAEALALIEQRACRE